MTNTPLKSKDFATDQDVRWCPGCGDYSILKQFQSVLAELALDKDKVAVISGIGCSSRFPYYMETYGMHSIHGRAPAVATGLRLANPDLEIWVITGDGDGLSIGGNHLLHVLRRNVNLNILLFNNQIYGLTKGQYSPTSELNKATKSTPFGSVDHPVNPLSFAMGANASFVARSMDRDPKHLKEVMRRAHAHKGASLLEVYQNCNIFNDGAFSLFTEKQTKLEYGLFLEQGQPLVFGANNNKGIRLDGYKPQVVDLEDGSFGLDDLWVHDEQDQWKAQILTRFFDDPTAGFPRPFGVLYAVDRPTYDGLFYEQLEQVTQAGAGTDEDLQEMITGRSSWTVD